MKTQSIQQEILVITGTKFSSREWAEKDSENNNKRSAIENLENACWNGLLDEMFPELIQKTAEGKQLFLWHIRHCRSFLGIELSESAPLIVREFSIDPYFFMETKIMN